MKHFTSNKIFLALSISFILLTVFGCKKSSVSYPDGFNRMSGTHVWKTKYYIYSNSLPPQVDSSIGADTSFMIQVVSNKTVQALGILFDFNAYLISNVNIILFDERNAIQGPYTQWYLTYDSSNNAIEIDYDYYNDVKVCEFSIQYTTP